MEIGAIIEEEKEDWHEQFYDNLSGEALDPIGVRMARKEYMEEVRKHGV